MLMLPEHRRSWIESSFTNLRKNIQVVDLSGSISAWKFVDTHSTFIQMRTYKSQVRSSVFVDRKTHL